MSESKKAEKSSGKWIRRSFKSETLKKVQEWKERTGLSDVSDQQALDALVLKGLKVDMANVMVQDTQVAGGSHASV